MSNMNKSKQLKTKSGTQPAVNATVAAVQKVARAMPAAAPVTAEQLHEMRNVVSRAPANFIALVLSEAEAGGGNVAGVPIDATASRSDVAQATALRVGAAAARAIARRLEQESLTLASGVAQRALSATTSLEAYARTPEGRSHAAKAAELRTAARAGSKRKAKTTTESAPAPAAAAEAAPATTGTPPAAPAPAPKA